VDHVLDAASAEALALLRGLEFLEQIGVSNVIVESDSLSLIQACNSLIKVWSPFSAILAK
jgi:ribonuclease HI